MAKSKKQNIIDGLLPLSVDIESVHPDPRNARRHPQRNLEAITRSLHEFGQRRPIVVNADGTVIAGNGMLQAAEALGWKQIAAVAVNDDASRATAYGLVDNKSAELAEWDLPVLKDLLLELDTGDFDMDLTGFSVDDIEGLMTQLHEPEIIEADEHERSKVLNYFANISHNTGMWAVGRIVGKVDLVKLQELEKVLVDSGAEDGNLEVNSPILDELLNRVLLR